MNTIRRIETAAANDLNVVRTLFTEYAQSLDFSLCFQGFAEELAALPGKYAPPRGALLLAEHEGQAAGCVALREIGPDVCEMKRLFVRPAFRGCGLGRELVEAIVVEGRRIGYAAMRLDTIASRMQSAISLYESLGFRRTEAYCYNPQPDVVYMELTLRQLEPA